jgi:Ca-activated chloride channel family protein
VSARVWIAVGTFLGALIFGALGPVLARGEVWFGASWRYRAVLLIVPVIPFAMGVAAYLAEVRMPRIKVPSVAILATGPAGWRAALRDVAMALRAAALVFAIGALARPQTVLSASQTEESGIDIVIVLDLSESMRAVMEDGLRAPKPASGLRPTRLDVAKDTIVEFVSRRKADRIGVVVFGVSAFVLSPPTLDYTLLNTLVTKVSIDDLNGRGTAIGDAVGTGVARLRRSSAKSKVIILLTDGDSNAGAVAPEMAIELARTTGVQVHTIQIGNGDEVDVLAGADWNGRPQYQRVRYPVNPELLKKMAQTTGGESFIASDRSALEKSMHAILDKLEKTHFSADSGSLEELFSYLLAPAVALLLLEVLARVFVAKRFP